VTNVSFECIDRRSSPPSSGRAARDAEIAALVAHPAMPEVLRSLFTSINGLIQGHRILNLIVTDRSRMVMGWLTLFLDASYDQHDPLSGLTVNRYKALCARSGLSSPGRGAAMLGLMRFAGYLEPATRASRGLPLRLVPTAKLIEPQRLRLRFIFKALACFRPEAKIGLTRIDEPVFFNTLVRCIGEQYLARERLIEHAPNLAFFAERKAGLQILMGLMLSAQPGDPLPPSGPISVSVRELARRYAVARSQVRELLRSGLEAGLLTTAGDDGNSYRMAPQLRASVASFIAAMLVLVGDAARQAQDEIAEPLRSTEGAA
jgi:hypothetical protein